MKFLIILLFCNMIAAYSIAYSYYQKSNRLDVQANKGWSEAEKAQKLATKIQNEMIKLVDKATANTAAAIEALSALKSHHDSECHNRKEETVALLNQNIFSKLTFSYLLRESNMTVGTSLVDPLYMDDGAQGRILVGKDKYTRQPIYRWPKTGNTIILYGQTEYSSLQDALHAGEEPIGEKTALALEEAIPFATLVIKQNVTDLTAAIAAGAAVIIPPEKIVEETILKLRK